MDSFEDHPVVQRKNCSNNHFLYQNIAHFSEGNVLVCSNQKCQDLIASGDKVLKCDLCADIYCQKCEKIDANGIGEEYDKRAVDEINSPEMSFSSPDQPINPTDIQCNDTFGN